MVSGGSAIPADGVNFVPLPVSTILPKAQSLKETIMSLDELRELVRSVSHGRGDAVDKLAEVIHGLMQKPAPEPKVPAKKAPAKKAAPK